MSAYECPGCRFRECYLVIPAALVALASFCMSMPRSRSLNLLSSDGELSLVLDVNSSSFPLRSAIRRRETARHAATAPSIRTGQAHSRGSVASRRRVPVTLAYTLSASPP